jgi:hypothetical protein
MFLLPLGEKLQGISFSAACLAYCQYRKVSKQHLRGCSLQASYRIGGGSGKNNALMVPNVVSTYSFFSIQVLIFSYLPLWYRTYSTWELEMPDGEAAGFQFPLAITLISTDFSHTRSA